MVHSLCITRCRIGSQCKSSRNVAVMWSYLRCRMTRRAAASRADCRACRLAASDETRYYSSLTELRWEHEQASSQNRLSTSFWQSVLSCLMTHVMEAAPDHWFDMLGESQLAIKDHTQAGDLSDNRQWYSPKVNSCSCSPGGRSVGARHNMPPPRDLDFWCFML